MLIRLKRAQSTAEYAVIIGVVIGAAIAMQTFVRRSLQARQYSVTRAFTYPSTTINLTEGDFSKGSEVKALLQYEPYYDESQYDVASASRTDMDVDSDYTTDITSNSETRREELGYTSERVYSGRKDLERDLWGAQ